MDNAESSVDQTQSSNDGTPQSSSSVPPKPSNRSFVQYTRAELLHLSKSPLVKIPDGMPAFKDWFGEWTDTGTAARKEPTSESLGQLSRDRTRFRRDTEEGDGTRESLSGRPAFKNALTFSQASGSAMGSMGSFRHPSSLRLESDARREEREREREREGRRDTENLRNLSVQFDRERRDRDAAPHLPRAVSGASNASGRDAKSRDAARDSREPAKDSTRDLRRGRGDDTNDWRRARDDDRQRSRSRQRRGDREPPNGQKREREGWVPSDDRRAVGGAAGRRRGGPDERPEGRPKDDRAPLRSDRDKPGREEQEPAWMGDYVPETGGQGILGSGAEDGIQAWKRELKEKERGIQGADDELLEDDGLGGLEDEVGMMKLVEEKAKQEKLELDDGLDEIQRFKKLMQASDKQRREEAERNARELAGKANLLSEYEQHEQTNGTADTQPPPHALSGPPGLSKSTAEPQSAPTPPPAADSSMPTNGRVGGVSLASPNWPMPTSVAPSATTPSIPSTGWTQSGASGPDSSPPNPRLSPVQPRRFTQDGGLPPMGNQDGAQIGTRSTSRFANFFGDKQRDPAPPRFNENSTSNSPHSPFISVSNEPQLLDSLLARLAESQVRPQTQAAPQSQDRSFAQRTQGIPSQQAQYGNALAQNAMNMQHTQPPLIQHQRAQLSLHQQQQQLLSSLNASNMLPGNVGGLQGMNHGGPSPHMSGMNSGALNPGLNLDVDGRFVSDNLVPGLRPRNGSIAFDEDFQVSTAGGVGRVPMQQHRPQQSYDAMHSRPQQQQPMYNMGGNRTPSGGYRNGPSPIGGHNPNPMQRAPELPQYLNEMARPLGGGLGGVGAGSTNGPQPQYSNRLGGMGNLGGMLGATGAVSQPRFDERQRMQQGQNAPMHHQSGQSLSSIGGLPLDFGLLQQQQQQQQASQRQMPRGVVSGVGGYPMQNQAQMGPRNSSGLHGIGAQQYPAHMHNDLVVQPNQTTNANEIMAMFLANQGNNGMGV